MISRFTYPNIARAKVGLSYLANRQLDFFPGLHLRRVLQKITNLRISPEGEVAV